MSFQNLQDALYWLGLAVAIYFLVRVFINLAAAVLTYGLLPKANVAKYGKWSVVTGASDGIGKEFAIQLAERGQNIVLISRTLAKLQSVAQDIESTYGVKTKVLSTDFGRGDCIYDEIAQLIAGLDIGTLVNNVGTGPPIARFTEMPDPSQAIRNTVEVNIISVLKMTQLILPEMVKKQRGLIINVSSGGCVAPLPSLAVYGATKSFVDYFSRCISHEYEVEGIKAVCIMPYFVSSNLTLNAKPNFWLRSAKDYVRNVLAVTTTSTRWSHGCWQHDVHGWMGRNLPHKVYATSIGLVLQRIKNKQM